MNTRIKALRKKLAEAKVDALILTTDEDSNKNVRYISGFGGSDGTLLITQKKALGNVNILYTERYKKEAPNFSLIPVDTYATLGQTIATLIKEARLSNDAKIGFEARQVSVEEYESWKKDITQPLIATSGLVEHLRQTKDAEELKLIARACKASSNAYHDFISFIKAGMRECDIAREVDRALLKHGAARTAFGTIVASGPNAAIPHHESGNRKLKAGDAVIIDYGGEILEGYSADITRTFFVPGAKPDPELAKIYDIVLRTQRHSTKVLKPGISWLDFHNAGANYIKEHGYGKYFEHSLTHSLGLDSHDPFNYKECSITEGTVFTNEPGIYLPGKGGVRIEDDFVMTKTGPKKLTNIPYNPFI